jgi:hypothetical protein
MDYDTMRELVESITYKPGWTIYFNYDGMGVPYVQIGVDITTEAAMDSCSKTGERAPWKGSRRFLSSSMCRQEIVGAVFGLISDAESHEMREWFRYKGASIYNPHLDPDALVPVARKKASFSIRENAMTMEEPSNMTAMQRVAQRERENPPDYVALLTNRPNWSRAEHGDRGGGRAENSEGDTLEGRIVDPNDPNIGSAGA